MYTTPRSKMCMSMWDGVVTALCAALVRSLEGGGGRRTTTTDTLMDTLSPLRTENTTRRTRYNTATRNAIWNT